MYTLRYPFSLPIGKEIKVTEESANYDHLNFTLNKQGRFYVFTITGFQSVAVGNEFIKNIWAGLMWLLLHKEISINAELKLQKMGLPVEDMDEALVILSCCVLSGRHQGAIYWALFFCRATV